MNIYQILDSLTRIEENSNMPVAVDSTSPVGGNVQEGQMKEYMWKMAERLSLADFLEHFPEDEEFWRAINDDINDDPQTEGFDDDDDYETDEGDFVDDPRAHVQTKNTAPLPDQVQQQIIRNPAMRADIIAAYKRQQGMAEGTKFKFANPKQRPGDQVRGTERAVKKKSGEHPFKGRLVGAAESVEEEKTRLDPKCWKGYKKQGTKVKGGVRVNNCVPVEEEWESFIEAFGADNPSQQNQTPQEKAKELATTQQSLNKLKSAGANITNVQQAAQTVLKPEDKPMNPTDMKQLSGWGKDVEQIIDDPALANQLAALIQKSKQG